MALEHILAALETEIGIRIAEVEEQARLETNRLATCADSEATAIRSRHLAAIQPQIQAVQARLIHAARLDAQRAELEMEETLISAVMDEVQQRLAKIRSQPDYPAILMALTCEVVDELGTPLSLHVDARDVNLLQGFLSRFGTGIRVEPDLHIWGGLVGQTPDGRIRVDNTLETRLATARERWWGRIGNQFCLQVRPAGQGKAQNGVTDAR